MTYRIDDHGYPVHPETGDRLTRCCTATPTFSGDGVLCCRACYTELNSEILL